MSAALLAAIALGGGCGGRTQPSSSGQALGVLWREPPALPAASTTAPLAAAAPSADEDIIWTVHLQEVASLAALASACPQVISQPGGAVVPEGLIEPLLVPAQVQATGTGMNILEEGPQPVMWSFVSGCTYVADYLPSSDGLTPLIGTLHFGNAVALTGHMHGTDVVCDGVCARRLELCQVATYRAAYPRHGVLTQYPWEEPECLAGEADRRDDPVLLPPGQVLVIPFRCWMDRPTPRVHSFAVTIAAQSGAASGTERWREPRPAILIISALSRVSAGNPASVTDLTQLQQAGSIERIRTVPTLDQPARLLSPPWHGDTAAFTTPDHSQALDPEMQPVSQTPLSSSTATNPGGF